MRVRLTRCLHTFKRVMKAKKSLLSLRAWVITCKTLIQEQEPTCSSKISGSFSSSNTTQPTQSHLWRWLARKRLRMLWDHGVRSYKCLGLCQSKTRSSTEQLSPIMKILKVVAMSKTRLCRLIWIWADSRAHLTKSTWLCRTKPAATNLRSTCCWKMSNRQRPLETMTPKATSALTIWIKASIEMIKDLHVGVGLMSDMTIYKWKRTYLQEVKLKRNDSTWWLIKCFNYDVYTISKKFTLL